MSFLYVFSVMILYGGLVAYPKSRGRLSLPVWMVLSILTLMGIEAASGVLVNVIGGMPITLGGIGACNMVPSVILWSRILLVHGRGQEYSPDVTGWLVLLTLALCTLAVGFWRFGPSLNLFSYCTADSGEHLRRVEEILRTGHPVENRFFLHVNEALFMGSLGSLLTPMNYYRAFIAYDLFMWFLSGAIFYVLIHRMMTTRYMTRAGVLFVLLYFLGYPLNNMLYGYEYMGMTVTIAGYVLHASELLVTKGVHDHVSIVMMGLGILSATLAYTQFMPVILVGAVLYVAAGLMRDGRRIGYVRVGILLGCCVVAGAFAACHIILGRFGSLEGMFAVMTRDAAVYRDLWGNFLFFLPFIFLCLIRCCRERIPDSACFHVIAGLSFAGWFLWRVVNGLTASYYFYKFHYLLWLYALHAACKGLGWFHERYGRHFMAYAGMIGVILLIDISDVETILQRANPLWNIEKVSDDYTDIYSSNLDCVVNRAGNMDMQRQELFYAVAGKASETGTLIPYIGEWEEHWMNYYYSLTNQGNYWAYFYYRTDEFSRAEEDGTIAGYIRQNVYDAFDIRYVMVEKNTEAYWADIGYYSRLEAVYENDYGILYKR